MGPNDPLSGYKQGGPNAQTYDVSCVDTRIRYESSRHPPFTVMPSMPSKPWRKPHLIHKSAGQTSFSATAATCA